MSHLTRRQFLENSMLAAAATVAAGSTQSLLADEPAKKQSTSPNERLNGVVIGCNGRGSEHLNEWTGRKDTLVTYIVDPDENVGRTRAEFFGKRQGHVPQWVPDLRTALDDPSVDFASTATPNHWHSLVAIWAMQRGKDMYVEKPVSHNVSEGRRVVETARKYNKICQTGTQCRSMTGMRDAMQFIHDGKIGKVTVARGLCYKRRTSIGPKGEYPVPANINYDLWLGPAPLATVTRPRFHYDWHWQWPYGNGDLGNQGIHQMDLARWGLGVDKLSNAVFSYGGRLGYEDAGETANTQVVVHDYGDRSLIFEVRGLETAPYKNADVGVIFEGSDGYVVMASYNSGAAFDKQGQMFAQFKGDGDHFGNFIDAVRSRKVEDLHADILEGHLSSALCHLGNISYRLGQPASFGDAQEHLKDIKSADNVVDTFERFKEHLAANQVDVAKTKLQWGAFLAIDPAAEKFVNNSVADAMLTREYRAPYVVPPAGMV